MTQETNDVVGLIERLELSASESEMGRNLAGTPQTCRAAKARLQSQSARIAELEGLISEESIERLAKDIAVAVVDPMHVTKTRHSAMVRLGERLRNPLPRELASLTKDSTSG